MRTEVGYVENRTPFGEILKNTGLKIARKPKLIVILCTEIGSVKSLNDTHRSGIHFWEMNLVMYFLVYKKTKCSRNTACCNKINPLPALVSCE